VHVLGIGPQYYNFLGLHLILFYAAFLSSNQNAHVNELREMTIERYQYLSNRGGRIIDIMDRYLNLINDKFKHTLPRRCVNDPTEPTVDPFVDLCDDEPTEPPSFPLSGDDNHIAGMLPLSRRRYRWSRQDH
jgi:hypothetical protein